MLVMVKAIGALASVELAYAGGLWTAARVAPTHVLGIAFLASLIGVVAAAVTFGTSKSSR
jgi:hypothetical protein